MNNQLSRALTILVTRPDPQGFELCCYLENHGYNSLFLPTIGFASVKSENTQAVLQALGHQDWLIFTSPRSVLTSVPFIRQAWPELPPQVRFAAVGKGTANALREAGYLAIYPEKGEGVDYLLDLPDFKNVAAQSVTIIKGVNGREILYEVLTNRQAHVTMWTTYERILPDIDVQACINALKRHQLDAIVCTSWDSVRNLETLIGVEHAPLLRALPLIVVSERIRRLAQDLGYQTTWVAAKANHDAILDVLEQKKEVLCKIQQTKHVQPNQQ